MESSRTGSGRVFKLLSGTTSFDMSFLIQFGGIMATIFCQVFLFFTDEYVPF